MPITSSSISSSESGRSSATAACQWRSFAAALLGGTAAIALLAVGLLFVIDPYDTGRPGLVTKAGFLARPGEREQGPRRLAASRGRDPAFDAAIIGNSHVQILNPERLGPAARARFVSLAVPGTGPREHLVLLDWFARHHNAAAAIVIGADGTWCTDDPDLPSEHPFPEWIFAPSLATYLIGLMRFPTLEEVGPRLAYLLTAKGERARRDGYWDYETDYVRLGWDVRPGRRAILGRPREVMRANATGRFPAIERLAERLRRLPAATAVIVLHPPVYATAFPSRFAALAPVDRACKAAFSALAQARPRSTVVDWRIDFPEAHEPALWFDHTHYRHPLAQRVERSLAEAIRDLR
jgi:hypothetical protein